RFSAAADDQPLFVGPKELIEVEILRGPGYELPFLQRGRFEETEPLLEAQLREKVPVRGEHGGQRDFVAAADLLPRSQVPAEHGSPLAFLVLDDGEGGLPSGGKMERQPARWGGQRVGDLSRGRVEEEHFTGGQNSQRLAVAAERELARHPVGREGMRQDR